MLTRSFLFFLLLLGTLAWAATAQEPHDPVREQGARWLTVHDFGVQVRVEAPQEAHADWQVRVLDLGPQVPHLREDLVPTQAQLLLLGRPPVRLQPQGAGEWLAEIPRAWLVGGVASAQIQVMHQQRSLVDTSIRGLFL